MTKILKFTYVMILLLFLFLFITDAGFPDLLNRKMPTEVTFGTILPTDDACITFLDCLHVHCLSTQTQLCVMNKCECTDLTG
ncbi:unnamed protein product [Trifolium pratense]|uniref:Uncharacterized protein n=1 Tax=Trifolium pratense TaxID=57577 RepID=A0ACB0LLA2_TRIPR|nr:unnamed protein product [Trifolium pratense]